MIRLWLSRRTPIPVREQLSAQLILGILSRRLAPGERLPSVRDLARKLKLHPNTVSATYKDLAARGWVVQKRGSGVFVREMQMPKSDGTLDAFVRSCLEEGLARGFPPEELQRVFGRTALEARAQRLLVVDPDTELARVLATEIHDATMTTVDHSNVEDAPRLLTPDTCVLVNARRAPAIHQALGAVSLRTIPLKSMEDVLLGQTRPPDDVLIGVVSHSPSILHWASTLLSALGFPPDSVIERNPGQPRWQDGLAACDLVAADVVAAALLPPNIQPIVFRLVTGAFLAELRDAVTVQKVS